jgi:hypothetical protein
MPLSNSLRIDHTSLNKTHTMSDLAWPLLVAVVAGGALAYIALPDRVPNLQGGAQVKPTNTRGELKRKHPGRNGRLRIRRAIERWE